MRRVLICALVVLGSVGCSSDAPTPTSTPAPPATERPADTTTSIGGAPTSTGDSGGVDERTVVIDGAGGTTAATFVQAASTGPHPAFVLIAGSGPTDRDGNNPLVPGRVDNLRALADQLAAAGISSVRFDKIGIGETPLTGDPLEIDFTDYVRQARDVLAWLREQPGIDPGKVGIIGHSEGGLIALDAAVTDGVRLVGLFAPPGGRYLDLIADQLRAQVPAAVLEAYERAARELRADGRLTTPIADPILSQLFAPESLAFLVDADRRDPVELAGALPDGTTVVLACAALDVQVPCDSLGRLRTALGSALVDDLVVANANHVFRITDGTADPASYGDESLPHATEPADAVIAMVGSR